MKTKAMLMTAQQLLDAAQIVAARKKYYELASNIDEYVEHSYTIDQLLQRTKESHGFYVVVLDEQWHNKLIQAIDEYIDEITWDDTHSAIETCKDLLNTVKAAQ